MTLIDAELLSILRCTLCLSPLVEEEAESRLRCTECGHLWPVLDGIPDMIPPENAGSPTAPLS